MPELSCTVHRVGDLESRTEEYEMSYAVEGAQPRGLRVKYQAARAYEINAALDNAVEAARAAISDADPGLRGPTDEALQVRGRRTRYLTVAALRTRNESGVPGAPAPLPFLLMYAPL
jgi:hypothetical protein